MMDKIIKNIVVVTGASSGIGKEFLLQLFNNRNDIDEFWIIARELKKLVDLKKELNDSKKIKILSLDLSCDNELKRYKKELIKDENIKIILLINCAGFGKFEHEENLDTDIKLNMIDLNVKAIVSMIDYSIKYMGENSGIINISSTAAFQPIPYINIYSATKSFVLNYSRALNRELRYKNIKVLAVCPYWTKTNFFSRAVRDGEKEVVIKYIVMYSPKDVVRRALKDFYKKNKDISIYGFKNNAQIFLTKFLPHKLVMNLWMKQQKLDGTPEVRKNSSIK